MAKLSKALRTDLNEVAALLRSKGRGRDTILAHINPEEAALLRARGGSGNINPNTGLPEFEDGSSFDWFSPSTWFGGSEPTTTAIPDFEAPATSVEAATPTPIQDVTPQYYNVDTAAGSYGPGGELLGSWSPELNAYAAPQYAGQETAFGSYGPQGQLQGVYSPEQGMYTSQPGFVTGGAPVSPGLVSTEQKAPGEKGVMDTVEEYARKYPKAAGALESLLGTGAKIGLGYLGAKPMQRTQTKAAQEAQAMADQYTALGKPIQAMGYQQLAQAEAGQLTPAQQRQMQATRAQQKQALSRAGVSTGTAALQTEANLQRMANEFTQNNISTALNMIQFGDKYVAQGIRAGYDANTQANQSANIFYQNLFGLLGGTGNVLKG